MPRMSNTVSVAANGTSANVLAGLLHEILAADADLNLLAVSAATGVNATLIVGTEAVVNDQLISVAAAATRLVFPDDLLTQTAGAAGERLFLTFRNTTAAPIVVTWAVDVFFR